MRWILEDLLTHETLAFTLRGKWSIGRKDDPAETILDDKSHPLFPHGAKRADIIIPITDDFEKTRELFQKYQLTSRISRFHGILGIDAGGPYFIDFSPNGTLIKGVENRICENRKVVPIHHGDTIYLARTYPLLLKNEGFFNRLKIKIFEVFLNLIKPGGRNTHHTERAKILKDKAQNFT